MIEQTIGRMAALIVGVIVFVLLIVFGGDASESGDVWTVHGPDCPQEDSCYVDYYDGAWHVIEEPLDSRR